MNIKDSVVVITGGARGLGLAIAEALAKKGAKLAIIDVDQPTLEKSCADLGAMTEEVQGYAVDITDEDMVESTFNYILEDFGRVNVLINNAGILSDGLLLKVKEGQLLEKMSLDKFQAVTNVNVNGTFLCGREAALAMIASEQQGLIINMSSLARSGNIGQTNYAASKAAVASMSCGWAQELARYNIRSVAMAPGVMKTDMTAAMKPQVLERLEQAIPSKRLGEPKEVASTIEFIIENDYINGRIIEVDGGLRF